MRSACFFITLYWYSLNLLHLGLYCILDLLLLLNCFWKIITTPIFYNINKKWRTWCWIVWKNQLRKKFSPPWMILFIFDPKPPAPTEFTSIPKAYPTMLSIGLLGSNLLYNFSTPSRLNCFPIYLAIFSLFWLISEENFV